MLRGIFDIYYANSPCGQNGYSRNISRNNGSPTYVSPSGPIPSRHTVSVRLWSFFLSPSLQVLLEQIPLNLLHQIQSIKSLYCLYSGLHNFTILSRKVISSLPLPRIQSSLPRYQMDRVSLDHRVPRDTKTTVPIPDEYFQTSGVCTIRDLSVARTVGRRLD